MSKFKFTSPIMLGAYVLLGAISILGALGIAVLGRTGYVQFKPSIRVRLHIGKQSTTEISCNYCVS